jgi:hypothetical protein
MLNWTDLCGLLMMLAGTMSGAAAAHQRKAGPSWLILFGAAGLAIGFYAGKTSSKLSYRISDSKTLPVGLQFASYMLVPMISLLLSILVPALLVMMIYGHV